ncbi:MAG TPA: AAA family ATPase [Oscillatoriaceae cyanobacterium M33_DOE_052]|uniref:Serine/threonine-protein kinase PknK n=1 Tax=Planktothricoides sp. SpSt-374 TaxID=2282167 RepID=A0A7C3ZWV1_9CYAN|nr:AAA family ATPase [Oscillatoriaceae cyanobacterium M33_DOE_052]
MLTLSGFSIQAQIYESINSLVYRATRLDNNQPVIVKLHKKKYPTPQELDRYRTEYEITKSLHSPGAIKAYDLQKYHNSILIILEDFGGESLKIWQNQRQFTLEEFLQIAIATADSLAQIHAANTIHKDINPSNIVYNPATRQLKIIDFGIATQLTRENTPLKNPNIIEGTLAYMSPEQTGRMNRSLDYRTDFYSLGVTFYELLTKQLPFDTTDPLELVHCHIAKQPVPPHVVAAQYSAAQLSHNYPHLGTTVTPLAPIPPIISEIVMKLMAKSPEDRYQSAWGLKADLEECFKQLQNNGTISDFTLAYQDISDKFQIPQKLYGRETEISTIISLFEQAMSQSQMMLVAGYSGIGKSALVQELYKPVTEKRGYFIAGKFDQYQRNIPYSALVSAFGELVKQLLSENEAQLKQWRGKLQRALGLNGQIIIDVIPEIELIIGSQPAVPELGLTESQNRFNLVFQNFIKVFTQPKHPLALFLDDLQWADGASLQLMQVLMGAASPGLFLIGAYRDNEIFPGHPLILTFEEIAKNGTKIERIYLSPLDLSTVTTIIADTLKCPESRAKPLAELVHFKTGGNPFFMNEFLKSLYADGWLELVRFNPPDTDNTGAAVIPVGWQWNLAHIQQRAFTDNVVELIASKIQKLPESTQKILKIAAGIGNQFNLEILGLIGNKSWDELVGDLHPAVAESLVVPLGNRGELELAVARAEFLSCPLPSAQWASLEYQFVHDRVQQAAYSLISPAEKPRLHWQLGQLLLANTPADRLEEKIFDTVNQLNLGSELISQAAARLQLAQLNLMAGQKAKASAAYQPALNYLQLGIGFLEANSWQSQYHLTLQLHVAAAEVAYLTRDFAQMQALGEIVLENANNLLDKVKVYEIQLAACTALVQPQKAVAMGREVLQLLGVKFPENLTPEDVDRALAQTATMLMGKNIPDLRQLPEMTDPEKLAALRILSSLVSPTYISAPLLLPLVIVKMVHLSVAYGNAPLSAFAYGLYGLILTGVVLNIETGYQFGELALHLLEKFHANYLKTKIFYTVGVHIIHAKHHVRETIALLKEGYAQGLETGDLELGYSAKEIAQYSYFIGVNLASLEAEVAAYCQTLGQFQQANALNYTRIVHQAILNLLGEAANPWDLVGAAYNAGEMLPFHIKAQDGTGLHFFYFHKMLLCYLFDQPQLAFANGLQAAQYLGAVTGQLNVPLFWFYDSLVRLALCGDGEENAAQKTQQLLAVETNQEKLQIWVKHAPMNFQHKVELVAAERFRVLGENALAIDCYDRAISLAQNHEYLNDQALALELAAKFYLSQGKELTARAYMQEAYYCYQLWGAAAKLQDLETRYRQLLKVPITEIKDSTNHPVVTTTGTGVNLDIATIIKATEAISGEILLDKLLSRLMQMLMENAAAQRGYLILARHGKLLIEAEGSIENETVTVLQSIPVANCAGIPLAIVNYVARTQKPVVLNDATREGNFTKYAYIQKC